MIRHFYQDTDISCGAACMRMVLASFGIQKSESALVKVMGTKVVGFTKNDQFAKVAEELKLDYLVMRDAKVKDLRKYTKEGFRVIVNYIDPIENIGHFAVVKKVDARQVTLLDPTHGPNHKLTIKTFVKNWKSMFEPDVGLLIGIRK